MRRMVGQRMSLRETATLETYDSMEMGDTAGLIKISKYIVGGKQRNLLQKVDKHQICPPIRISQG